MDATIKPTLKEKQFIPPDALSFGDVFQYEKNWYLTFKGRDCSKRFLNLDTLTEASMAFCSISLPIYHINSIKVEI